MMMRQKNYKRGFTLVELVIVIAVIAVLAAVLIPTFASVISKANNSADLQLATNLTTAIADAVVDPDETSSAQNIRNHVKDFGYDPEDITTKNKNNVIVYNKDSRKIESLDISKISSDDLVPAYYAEEIIDGYIILSTGGNNLSQALYKLSNLPSTGSPANINLVSAAGIAPIATTTSADISSYMSDALKSISNADIRGVVSDIVESTLYINDLGEMYYIDIDGTNVTATKIDKSGITKYPTGVNLSDAIEPEKGGERPRTRVVFSEGLDEFEVDNLWVEKSGLTVIVPEHVTLTGSETEGEDMPVFSGNVSSEVIPESNIVTVDEIKEVTKTGDAERIILYTAYQVYTSDFSDSFANTLKMAEKIREYKNENRVERNPHVRIVVNSDVTISGNITIPDYITVEIPFALGNSNAKEVMEYDNGDTLGEKALGSAFPANDADNLSKKDEDKMYYLCGEGPGGGGDNILVNNVEVKDDEKTLEIFSASKNITTKAANYKLTIASGAKLTIKGKLTVGGVIGYPNSSGYQGHTSGAYGEINNNGEIVVEDGGVFDVWGFVRGKGEVIANENGMIFEPFVVEDYLDTLPTLALYPFFGTKAVANTLDYNSPFMRFGVMNIQTKCTLNYGSALYGRAELITFGSFCYCRTNAPLVTSKDYAYVPSTGTYRSFEELKAEGFKYDEATNSYTKAGGIKVPVQNGALVMSEGSHIVGSYDDKNIIKLSEDTTECEDYEKKDKANVASFGNMGVTTINIHGEVSTYGIKMDLLSGKITIQEGTSIDFSQTAIPVDTSDCILPVSYHLNFVVANDGNLTIGNGNKYALMPGSKFTVEKEGEVTIDEGSALYALDTYDNSEALKNLDKVLKSIDNSLTADEDGIYKIGEFKILTMVFSIVRKYYPSAKLLEANGFESSANLTVNGTVTVKNGGDLGGTVNSKHSGAKIVLEHGAGMGKILNLGGPNPQTDQSMSFFKSINNLLKNPEMGSAINEKIFDLFSLYNTTYQDCYLRVLGTDGNDILTEEYFDKKEETKTFAYNNATLEGTTTSEEGLSITNSGKQITIKSKVRTCKKESGITITMGSSTDSSGSYEVKITSFNLQDNKITISEKNVTVNTVFSKGWSIAQ